MQQDSIYPEVIADRYELIELLSQGGTSSVFRCLDRLLMVDVAIKLLSLEEILSAKGRDRFEHECQMLLHFDHPNIIHNLDYGIFEDIPYLVMELYVDEQGRPFTLKQLQHQSPNERLDWEDMQNIWVNILKGIALFHQHGLVHRDIKPENILLQRRKDGSLIPKLIDFGLVAVTSDESMRGRMLLSTPVEQQPIDSKVLHGTLHYMSPEQLDGQAVNAASDVYSLGIMLFNLLTGERHPDINPSSMDHLSLPDWLKRLIQKCLEEKPEDRPAEASEMLKELPEELLITSIEEDDLDRNAPTKHQLPESANTILLADPVNGRYQVLEEISSIPGSMHFSCRDLRAGEMLNIRLIPLDSDVPDNIIDEFISNCGKLQTLDHEGILSIKECGVDEELKMAFVVTEKLPDAEEGIATVADLMHSKSDYRLSWPETTKLFASVMTAVAAMHREEVTHGNLCPENIRLIQHADGSTSTLFDGAMDMQLCNANGNVVIPEFSGRKMVISAPREPVIPGTLDYMAPEQLLGEPPSPKTDVFSLGLTLYRMATGFSRQNFQMPCEVNPELPSWIDEVCRFALEEAPDNRVESAVLLETLVPSALRNASSIDLSEDGDATEQDQLLLGDSPTESGRRVTMAVKTEPPKPQESLFINDLQQAVDAPLPPDLSAESALDRERSAPVDMEEDVASTLSISLAQDPLPDPSSMAPPTPVQPPEKVVLRAIPAEAPSPPTEPEQVPMPPPPSEPTMKLSPAAATKSKQPPEQALVQYSQPNMPPKRLGSKRTRRRGIRRSFRKVLRYLPLAIISLGVAASCVVCFLLLDYLKIVEVFPRAEAAASNYDAYISKAKSHLSASRFATAEHNASLASRSHNLSEEQSKQATQLILNIRRAKEIYINQMKKHYQDQPADDTKPSTPSPPTADVTAPETVFQDRMTANLGIQLKTLPAGTFIMGTNSPDHLLWGPRHTVTISNSFWISQCEITQSQYTRLMGNNPSNTKGDNRPVDSISWYQAVEFCRHLTDEERRDKNLPDGYLFRLPTEAEWEYACKAGRDAAYFFGNDPINLASFAWLRLSGRPLLPGERLPTFEVGKKMPNPWGLVDIIGNVQEWCLDSVALTAEGPGNITYRDGVKDPVGTDGGYRICRGGSVSNTASKYLSTSRKAFSPHKKLYDLGFRVVLARELTPDK